MSNKRLIAIEIDGERYEREVPDFLFSFDEFSELFREAGLIEDDETLYSLDSTQAYMLDR